MPKLVSDKAYLPFTKGLITEVSPLAYPEGATLDEDNIIITRTGERERRLGLKVDSDSAWVQPVASYGTCTEPTCVTPGTVELPQNGCFHGETWIYTPTGLVQIKDIHLNQIVFSFDFAGNLTESIVTKIDIYENKPIFSYILSNGTELLATDNHRVLTQNNEFIALRYFNPNLDRLITLDLDQVSLLSSNYHSHGTVYNLKHLTGEKTFIANGIRVSNISYVLPEI